MTLRGTLEDRNVSEYPSSANCTAEKTKIHELVRIRSGLAGRVAAGIDSEADSADIDLGAGIAIDMKYMQVVAMRSQD